MVTWGGLFLWWTIAAAALQAAVFLLDLKRAGVSQSANAMQANSNQLAADSDQASVSVGALGLMGLFKPGGGIFKGLKNLHNRGGGATEPVTNKQQRGQTNGSQAKKSGTHQVDESAGGANGTQSDFSNVAFAVPY